MRHDDDRQLLTRKELAVLLEKNLRTIAKWKDEGLPVAKRGRGGRPSLYDEAEVRAWVQVREENARQAGTADPALERALKDRAQRALAEQLFQIRARTLLPADEVERALAAKIAGARALILTSYTSAADRIFSAAHNGGGVSMVERELKALANEVLQELADQRIDGAA